MSEGQEKWRTETAIYSLRRIVTEEKRTPLIEVAIAAREIYRFWMLRDYFKEKFPDANIRECRDTKTLLQTVSDISRGWFLRWLSSVIGGSKLEESPDGIFVIVEAPKKVPERKELNLDEVFSKLWKILRNRLESVVPILILHTDAYSVTGEGEQEGGWEIIERSADEKGIRVINAGEDNGKDLQRIGFRSLGFIQERIFGRDDEEIRGNNNANASTCPANHIPGDTRDEPLSSE